MMQEQNNNRPCLGLEIRLKKNVEEDELEK